jgi:hypothetical protein
MNMSDLRLPEPALTAGLLMEGAQSQQQLAAAALAELRAHTAGLDAVVRDEIHRTLVEGLQDISLEVTQLGRRLRALGRRSRWHAAGVGLALSLALALCGAAYWWLPSPSSVAALAAQETQLRASLVRLRQQGAGVQLRQCGYPQRLCVRIDPRSPRFGDQGDFAVLGAD